MLTGAAALVLSGCAGVLRSHDSEMSVTLQSAMSGQVDKALEILESNNKFDKNFLYFLEKGELLRLKGAYAESRDAWLSADEFVRQWEEEAKHSPEKLLGNIGAVLINDKTRRYDGADYEKVALAARLALDHAVLGDWDNARIEVRKMHEREAVIAEFRAREVEKLKEQAEAKNIRTQVEDLKGYPVELLNSREVTGLRNSYQSAFGHYLAGFVYEVSGEPGLAAAGYRQAIELRPDVPMLKQALAGLDRRVRRPNPKFTDTLIVAESGKVPALKSVTIPIPVPGPHGFQFVPTSFPTIDSIQSGALPTALRLENGKSVDLHGVTSFDSMARRELRDNLPGIIVRGTLRAIAKGAMQQAVARNDNTGFAGLLMMAANFVTESADERMWRSLPGQVALGRALLPPGKHTAELMTSHGPRRVEFEVKGPYSIVVLRTSELGNVFVAQAVTPEIAQAKFVEPKPEPARGKRVKPAAKPVTAAPSKS